MFIRRQAGCVSPTAGRRQWRDRRVSTCSSSTVSPHGLLPPSSFYSLLLGDASLSPKVIQAKTPLSSFARAGYQGNSAVPPLLFCTHLLSSFFLLQSLPLLRLHLLLFSFDWTQILFSKHQPDGDMWIFGLHPEFNSGFQDLRRPMC